MFVFGNTVTDLYLYILVGGKNEFRILH